MILFDALDIFKQNNKQNKIKYIKIQILYKFNTKAVYLYTE